MHDADAAVPPELLATALEMTWTVGEHSRYELEPAWLHFAVLRAAQLVNRAFYAASVGPFKELLVGNETALRWLEAMKARGVLDERAAMLRALVTDEGRGDPGEILRQASDNLVAVAYRNLKSLPQISLPLVHCLSVQHGGLETLAMCQMPSLRTVHIGHTLPGSAPAWSRAGTASLRSSTFAVPSHGPELELVNLERLVNLRSLAVRHLYSAELDALFGNMTAAAPSIERLSLDFVQASLEDEAGDPQATLDELRRGCACAARRLPWLNTLSLPFKHGNPEPSNADYVLGRMDQLIGIDANWPRLQRVEVGLTLTHDARTLFSLPENCVRRGIELVRLIECVARCRHAR